MSIPSRAFKGNSHRNSHNFLQNNIPLRNHNTNYYEQSSSSKNYNTSREFSHGIFTNELNKRDIMKKKQKQPIFPQLEIMEILPQNQPNKIKSSSKAYGFNRESRDYRQSRDYRESGYHNEVVSAQQMNKFVTKENETLRNQIFNKMFSTFQEYSGNFNQNLQEIVNQMNSILSKRQQSYNTIKQQSLQMKQEILSLNTNFIKFNKEYDDKMETMVNQISLKKSKNNGEYGVDIKSSFQGLNSSLSGNYGTDNSSSKLMTEAMFQLDNIKKELAETKVQMEELNIKMVKPTKEQFNHKQITPHPSEFAFQKQELKLLVSKLLKEDKRQGRIDERIQTVQSRLYSLNQILKDQEQNIIGMNEQMKNIFNNQTSPKLKKIESSLIDIYSKIDRQVLQLQIKKWVQVIMLDKLKDSRVLRVRNSNKSQSDRLNSINGSNQDKITFKETYLIDDENYLMDSQGNYLVQEIKGVKKRIKIQENLLYLLKLKGIEIINSL